MKRVYDVRHEISLNPRHDFVDTSINYHLHLMDAEEVLNSCYRVYFNTFEEFYNAVNDGAVRGATAYLDIFKKPKVCVYLKFDRVIISKRNFNEICLWSHAEEAEHLSIKTLAHNMRADEFIELLRERNADFFITGA